MKASPAHTKDSRLAMPTAPNADNSSSSLTSNTVRERILARLVSAAAQGEQFPADNPMLSPWKLPDGPSPSACSALASNPLVWRQINGLRVLRQHAASLADLCTSSPFFLGHLDTVPAPLAWLAHLNRPMDLVSEDSVAALSHSIEACRFAHRDEARQIPLAEAAFMTARQVPCHDRDLTRYLLRQAFPAPQPLMEYEVDVCHAMLRADAALSYPEWRDAMHTWRSKGLFYPLTVAASRMPRLEHWLPRQQQRSSLVADSFRFVLDALNGQSPTVRDSLVELRVLASAWDTDPTITAHTLAGLLDTAAILMGVKSNGTGDCSLGAGLQRFCDHVRSAGDNDLHLWWGLRSAIEDAFPPSLLLRPAIAPQRKGTWGYTQLSLQPGPGGCLKFNERQLAWLAPRLVFPEDPRGNDLPAHLLLSDPAGRLRDILSRLGDTATSPDLALPMLYPEHAHARLQRKLDDHDQQYADLGAQHCTERETVMAKLGALALQDSLADPEAHQQPRRAPPQHHTDKFNALKKSLLASIPPVQTHHFSTQCRMLCWRVDVPPRAIVYTGDGKDVVPSRASQEHLPKVLLNTKLPAHTASALIPLPPGCPVSDDSVRMALRQYARAGALLSHPANSVTLRTGEKLVSTGLAEAFACFTQYLSPKRTTVSLGASSPWQQSDIEPRYSERQDASNGLRFRDWVAVFADSIGTEQARLASHIVEFSNLHTTLLPWLAGDPGNPSTATVRWVKASCTAPIDNRILQGRTLRQAVQQRYIQEPRLLPTRSPGAFAVTKANCELYEDGPRVAIAYAPVPTANGAPKRLELITFEACEEQE